MASQDRASTRLPPARRRARRDVGQLLARFLCVVFAAIGVVPFLLVLVVRSSWARAWATRETARVTLEHGIVASYHVDLQFWPLAVELSNVRVESSDGGDPLLVAPRASVRPKFFGLLSGKLAIDQIDVDAPHARVVLRDGKLQNVALKLPEQKKSTGPLHAPFNTFSITEGEVDLDIDGTRIVARTVDLDVTTDDDAEQGSSFEIKTKAGQSKVTRTRVLVKEGGEATVSYDEDTICLVDARVRVDPQAITIHNLHASGSVDLDDAEGTAPACNLPDTDRRKVELALSHTHVRLPDKKGDVPHVDGHVTARLPIGIAARAGSFPDNDGWIAVDADVKYGQGMNLPDLNGHFEAHQLRIDRYAFAGEIQSDIVTKQNVITSPKTTIRIAEGLATLTDVEVDPLKKTIPLKAKVDVKDASFAALMRDLGVSKHPHVSWDIKEVKVPKFEGTLSPLKLDGDMTAHTPNFAVYDVAVDDPSRTRIVGVKEAELYAHVSVRADALEFQRVRAVTTKSEVQANVVHIGFHEDLRVDVPSARVDLAEIGPLGSIPMSGTAQAQVDVSGRFGDPKLEAEIGSIQGFVFSDIPFGTVNGGHASLDGLVLTLKAVKATKNKSTYEMPAAKLDFGGNAVMVLDATATSSGFAVRDFFALWHLEEDPRFTEIDGTFTTSSNVHVALGGREDKCGSGFIDVDAHAHLKDVKLFGEAFEDGDLDLDYEWDDRLAGTAGARIEVHAATLRKVRPNAAGMAVGTVLASANIDHGDLNGNVVLQGIPISRIQTLGAAGAEIDGSVSGFAQVSGTMDAYKLEGDVDVTPVLVRSTRLGGSHLHLKMTQDPAANARTAGKTKCGRPIPAEFDKEQWAREQATATQGAYALSGELFGGQAKVEDLVVTRSPDPQVKGKLSLEKLDLGAVARIAQPPVTEDENGPVAPQAPVEGEITGTLFIEKMQVSQLGHAQARFVPGSLTVARGGQRLAMRTTSSVLTVADDTLSVPPLTFDLQAQGLKGAVTLRGQAKRLTAGKGADLAFNAELAPIDLGVLVGIVPKVDRAQGKLAGSLYVTGKAQAPEIKGQLQVRGGELVVHDFPSPISAVEIDVQADTNEVRITRGQARFAGGTVAVTGRVPVRGFNVGAGEVNVMARSLHLQPQDGVTATLDADLVVRLASLSNEAKGQLPHVTGDVMLTSFEYTRPIALTTDLSALGVRAKRTVVETYDPSLDAMTLDVRVRSRGPLRIHNNLVEIGLKIDEPGLQVTGTNQRVGLRGELRAQQGGRFHLQATEFDVRQASIKFEDPTRIDPQVDLLAVTEYRRSGASTVSASSIGSRQSGLWRITLHAYGDTDNLHLDMTSDPPLAQEDIVLLLLVGMTRAEIDQLQQGAFAQGVALDLASTATGASSVVKNAIPVIDDFRFGSGYSTRTGRTEPQVTVGKRITDDVRASVTTGLSEDRELRSNIEWRLGQRVSVQGSYDNVNDVSSSALGNLGVDLRWRLEFR